MRGLNGLFSGQGRDSAGRDPSTGCVRGACPDRSRARIHSGSCGCFPPSDPPGSGHPEDQTSDAVRRLRYRGNRRTCRMADRFEIGSGTAATDAIRLNPKLAGTRLFLGLILTIGSQLRQGHHLSLGNLGLLVSVIPVILDHRWWRDVIFDRIQASRRRTSFQDWVAQRRKGWKSFPAAVSGGIYLFISGAYWIIRGWITGFDLARRAHAWFFRRGMDRMAGDQESGTVLMPIDRRV